MFSSGFSKFFVLPLLFAAAVAAGFYVRSHWPLSDSHGGKIAGAWSVERSGSGLAVSWNFDAPLFRNARNVTLEIEDGAERRKIPLDNSQRANTLFYAPRETDVTLRLQIQPEGAAEPAKTEVIRLGTQNAQPVVAQKAEPVVAEKPKPVAAEKPKLPETVPQEGTRSRVESPVSIWRVRAPAPRSLTSRLKTSELDVPVYVKIEPSGKVASASTRQYQNGTEAALAKLAKQAAMEWKFRPAKGDRRNPLYRDYVIHFKFPRT